TRSVPMPSLPRIRRTRSYSIEAVTAQPRVPGELSAAGLTWIHLDAPTLEHAQALAERYGWHALDVEDVMSKRQRPKVDDYAPAPRGLALPRLPPPGAAPGRPRPYAGAGGGCPPPPPPGPRSGGATQSRPPASSTAARTTRSSASSCSRAAPAGSSTRSSTTS